MLAVVALVAGCTAEAGGSPSAQATGASTTPAAPFAACDGLTAVPPDAGRDTAGADAPGGGPTQPPRPLPAVELNCFAGGPAVQVSAVRGPALINLWASWCSPCRRELPVFERYARRAAGQVHVVGVDTKDDREVAEDLVRELGITFPTLYDREQRLLFAMSRTALPVTLFVDRSGQVRFVYAAEALDEPTLARYAKQYLGVVVP
ncbi:TlpA family protein disulfide reductase [Rhizomonospora bruguierae]|uniref:TlpA family protein disulfide reductase n=1 Tax=Rhizomonospora bruguierae TaxID=1581705 RepID=UPI001BD0A33D|nr:TlpA disulfide reductase family protein [Micromonospora sp. NBRC 107566]